MPTRVVSLATSTSRHYRTRPDNAILLAAGLGKRMRPLTAVTPKPLIEVHGKAIMDYGLDQLKSVGLKRAIVNVHYLPDQIEAHCARYKGLDISISDERQCLLETGGGIKKVLPQLGKKPFFLLNGDSFWIEGARPNLAGLMEAWDETRMDMLMLLAPTVGAIGYDGIGDFFMSPEGLLTRRPERRIAPYAYPGAAIIHPRVFEDTPDGAFSLNLVFDRLIEKNRLYGVAMDGIWMHVGTPAAVNEAEFAIRESAA